jgi:hypothetical protein
MSKPPKPTCFHQGDASSPHAGKGVGNNRRNAEKPAKPKCKYLMENALILTVRIHRVPAIYQSPNVDACFYTDDEA